MSRRSKGPLVQLGDFVPLSITDKEFDKIMRTDVLKKELADRKNSGKPQLSYIGLDCLEDCARVMEFGAKKYARNNWRKGMPLTQLCDSLLRHIAKLLSGEEIDPESGLSHIGHIQCNAMFLGNKNNVIDIDFGEN